MINTLSKSLQIEVTYTINSFIYFLRKIRIFRNMFKDNIYAETNLKKLVGFGVIIFSFLRSLFLKFMYFFFFFIICYKYFFNNFISSFFHIYFVLTILGMFINNQLLSTNKQKYFAICLFNVDGTKYFRSLLFLKIITLTIFNSICIFLFTYYLMSPPNFSYSLMLIIFSLLVRLTGEALNIMFYRKYKYIWYTNTKIYFPIVLTLF